MSQENQTDNSHLTWLVLIIIAVVLLTGLTVSWFLLKGKNPPIEARVETPSPMAEFASPKGAIVKVKTPRASEIISSPLVVSGEVMGNWSFEANLPAILTDSDGKVIVQGFATLQGDWMTSDYVPFKGTLNFTKPESLTKGYLILKKDNPSGIVAQDDAVKIPVRF